MSTQPTDTAQTFCWYIEVDGVACGGNADLPRHHGEPSPHGARYTEHPFQEKEDTLSSLRRIVGKYRAALSSLSTDTKLETWCGETVREPLSDSLCTKPLPCADHPVIEPRAEEQQ